jgi:hypothetical protein
VDGMSVHDLNDVICRQMNLHPAMKCQGRSPTKKPPEIGAAA